MITLIRTFTISGLLCAILMPNSGALAAPERPAQERGPVKVTADRLEADDKAQVLVFSGNAVAVQGDVTLHGDRLTVKYSGTQRDIQEVIAEGSVRIEQGKRVATGAKAVLFRAEDRIVLTGSPKVSEGENFVQGEQIILYLNDQRSVVTGGEGGRVNAVFTPQTENKP
jgi:lipopolysaccharide export system protein LptA